MVNVLHGTLLQNCTSLAQKTFQALLFDIPGVDRPRVALLCHNQNTREQCELDAFVGKVEKVSFNQTHSIHQHYNMSTSVFLIRTMVKYTLYH